MSVTLSGPPRAVRGCQLDRRLLAERARRLLRELGHSRSELSLALVCDAEIAELNASWRGISGATDVLSFSLLEGEAAAHRGRLLGDVVIGVETAARQAAQRHRGIDETVARLLIHGVLHLLGHDHQRAAETRTMRRMERRLWKSLCS